MTELVVEGLQLRLAELASDARELEALADVRAALAEHDAEHPESKPSLAMIVESAAEIDGHPAAERMDLIMAGVADLGEEAFVEDVLAWVQGALAAESSSSSLGRRSEGSSR